MAGRPLAALRDAARRAQATSRALLLLPKPLYLVGRTLRDKGGQPHQVRARLRQEIPANGSCVRHFPGERLFAYRFTERTLKAAVAGRFKPSTSKLYTAISHRESKVAAK